MDSDDMDSLFDGMILFNPSQITSTSTTDTVQLRTVSVADDTSASSSASAVVPNEPLDENLFSDLTVIAPSSETLALSDPPLKVTKQSSFSSRRRKKSALRIGYGRDRDSYTDLDSIISESKHEEVVDSREDDSSSEKHYNDTVDSKDDLASTTPILSKVNEEVVECGKDNSSSEKHYNDNDSVDRREDLASVTPVSPNVVDAKNPNVEENSVELKFEEIKASIAGKLKLAQEAVMSVSALRKESIRGRRKAVHEFNGASSRHRELEKKLDEACEAEDFETADRVSEDLASAEKEKEGLLVLLREAEIHCDVVDSKMQEVLESLIQAEEECVSLLRRFSEEAASNADSVLINAQAVSSKDSVEWLSSVEAIEVSKFELEIQSLVVDEAKSILNESIDHSAEDDRGEMNVLCKRKEVLAEEYRKLLALVKEKEAEIAENDALIQKVESRIGGVVSSFKEVQASIDHNYDTLQSHLSELMAENEVLLKRKNDIDNYLSQEESRGEKIKNLSRISADEANMYDEVVGLRKSLATFISKSKAYGVSLAKSEESISEEVQFLKQETFSARSSLQELSSTKSSIQQEVESCKQRLLFIDRRIPELEAEKRVAATTRNFKEAARLAAEAKALGTEKEEIQSKMDSTESELKKIEEKICDTVDRLQETEVQISSKEKELAMARFQRLILIARAARAERAAALELGDHEEAEALVAEANGAEVEARKLQPIYDFKEEEIENLPKLFISSELVSILGGKQLAELAASANIVAS